jgi:predicted nucleotidyltransferase component of viral defense system
LYALWRAEFFEAGVFQGGTSLRILHGLPRFSEDLDFMLKAPDPHFDWAKYLQSLLLCFEEFGLRSEALPKGRMDSRIRTAIIKDNAIANQLNLTFDRGNRFQTLKIKLEIDVQPPAQSGLNYTFLDFPLDFEVCHQDLASNFARKLHALLCRGFVKGRDWYDFGWYVRQGVSQNLIHLTHALRQYGPWAGQVDLVVDMAWLKAALLARMATIDWPEAAADVVRFLKPMEQKSLVLWSERFFQHKVERMA